MKKLLALALSGLMVFSLSACGEDTALCSNCNESISKEAAFCEHCGTAVSSTDDTVSVNSSTNVFDEETTIDFDKETTTDSNKENTTEFDAETVKKQLAVKKYSYNSDFWNYAFIEITNNSKYDLDISADVKFYDASGALIGAKSGSQDAFQQGTSILLDFMPDEEFSSLEYELTVKEETYYDCVVKDLSYKSVKAKNKEIVSVTNNGTEAAEFVEGYMLFFKGNKVVGYENTYFVDDDSQLKPGATETREMSCYEEYDSYKFYLTGRID